MSDKIITEKVTINNPIGNLYRRAHVLILVFNDKGSFILGKKKGFYPEHIARMLGGGLETGEEPLIAAQREIKEELGVETPLDSFLPLCTVSTQAKTSEGDMQMQTWIYLLQLFDSKEIKPGDDVSGIQTFTQEEYKNLVASMKNLSGDFVTERFSFSWADWGKIYAPIHEHAIEKFNALSKDN